MMRNAVLAVIFALIFTLGTFAQATPQLVTAGPFATAEEAVNFANSLPEANREYAQFLCEYRRGTPATAAYRVWYETGGDTTTDQGLRWQTSTFSDLAAAVASPEANKNLSQFSPCFNPNRNPTGTTVTLFYIPEPAAPAAPYVLVDRSFASASEATAWANNNLAPGVRLTAQFLPELSAPTQTSSSWRIITSPSFAPTTQANWRWQAVENDSAGTPLQTDTALAVMNQDDGLTGYRLSVQFDTASTTSRIVLFTITVADEPTP